MTILTLIGLLFAGFVIFNILGTVAQSIYYFFKNRSLIKKLTPQKLNKDKLCKGPHPWISARTWTEKGEGEVQVCRACGFISGTETMVSSEAIDSIEDNNRIREVEKRLYKDFLAREDVDIKKYFAQEIESGLNFEKLLHVHTAGMTFSQRYTLYKASRAKDIEKELIRCDS